MEKIATQLNPLTARWGQLGERDRLALTVLAAVGFVAMIYFLIWQPVQSWSDESKLRYENNVALVNWIKQNQSTLLAAKGGGNRGLTLARNGRSVLSLVNQQARKLSLNIKRLEPKENDQLRVWVDGVEFNRLIELLYGLQRQFDIELLSINLEKGKESGMVNASLVLGG